MIEIGGHGIWPPVLDSAPGALSACRVWQLVKRRPLHPRDQKLGRVVSWLPHEAPCVGRPILIQAPSFRSRASCEPFCGGVVYMMGYEFMTDYCAPVGWRLKQKRRIGALSMKMPEEVCEK